MNLGSLLQHLRKQPGVRAVDVHLARELAGIAGDAWEAVAIATVLAGRALGRGSTCAELADVDALLLPDGHRLDPAGLAAKLQGVPTLCGDGSESGLRPLELVDGRIHFGRYWRAEQRVAARLRELAAKSITAPGSARARLDALFDAASAGAQGQRLACAVALTRGLAVISGGPGTGKTTTVTRLLLLLGESALAQGSGFRVALAAPTGKAANRLQQSLQEQRKALQDQGGAEPELLALLPDSAQTLHRLLGIRSDGSAARNATSPLALDLLVVDECSMVDLRLFDALLEALPAGARLVLIGDHEQLDAVEPGNLFAALCERAGCHRAARVTELDALGATAPPAHAMPSCVGEASAVLSHSYRFASGGGIGQLALALQSADPAARVRSLLETNPAGLRVLRYAPGRGELPIAEMAEGFRPLLRALADGADPETLLGLLERYRVLCPLREGEQGVEGLNRRIERMLQADGLLMPDSRVGRPVLVSRNDYGLGLFNGDLGLVVQDPAGGETVLFPPAPGRSAQTHRLVPLARLPAHDTAFAMTVHKSQGSESGSVCVLLPAQRNAAQDGGLEMFYTAITRARDSLLLVIPDGELAPHWLRRARRASALSQALHRD
jgi:exodeoxyribonuclease V alpha subunit